MKCILVITVLAAVASAQSTWTSCGAGSATVSSLALDKVPICRGGQVCVTVNGKLTAALSDATVELNGTFDTMTVYTATGTVENTPVSATTFRICATPPRSTWFGITTAYTLTVKNGDGSAVLCQKTDLIPADCTA
ncbi:hypothetical protein DFQ27_009634 [Actinomortierella ambigua]|uniref:Uncharacterized protein n=1 Tax=Actinomortierella ambigua TaxID=1343610 RepID=A0A9P6UAS5_9FUNG|nr:hypothetical protein DFQ27_009634 [Actinomortierella ambigua]